jgi:hypothetical protein
MSVDFYLKRVLDFDNFMEYQKKLISFHLNLADNFEKFEL